MRSSATVWIWLLTFCLGCGGAPRHAEEAGLSVDEATARLDQGMQRHGYVRIGAVAHMLAPDDGEVAAHALTAEGGRCYEAVALPVGEAELSLEVRGPADTLVGDASAGEHPSSHFCTVSGARFRFLVGSEGDPAEYYFLVYRAGAGTSPRIEEVIAEADEAAGEPTSELATHDAAGSPRTIASGDAAEASDPTLGSNDATAEAPAETSSEEATDATEAPSATAPPGSGAPSAASEREVALARARTLFERGLALVRDGNAQLGLVYLRQAFDISPRPGILINLAAAAAQTGEQLEAARAYARYLTMEGEGVTTRARRAARRASRILRRDVARVRFSLPAEENAYVQLNGEPVEAWMADIDYPVAPGAQELSYAVDGEIRGVARATVRRGARAVLRFEAP